MITSARFAANAQMSVQVPSNVVGTGSNAWHYLITEGESYVSKTADPSTGFTQVYGNEGLASFNGNPVLGTNTLASKRGALFTQTTFSQWADKITYQVVFDTPGTYYTYMRFTMFDNAGNGNYLSEDSFFMPPDFNKDPQFDWPITNSPSGRTGGYCEGGLSQSGFLWLIEPGTGGSRTNVSGNDGIDQTGFWEGHFHWNQLISSQFLNPVDTGEPNVPFKYEVTPAMVGIPQNFTIGYREGGVTIDLFLFSTQTNLMDAYTEAQLDQLLVNKVTVQPAVGKDPVPIEVEGRLAALATTEQLRGGRAVPGERFELPTNGLQKRSRPRFLSKNRCPQPLTGRAGAGHSTFCKVRLSRRGNAG